VIEPTYEQAHALWCELPAEVQDGYDPDTVRGWLRTALNAPGTGPVLDLGAGIARAFRVPDTWTRGDDLPPNAGSAS
jgi:hypothetical protein